MKSLSAFLIGSIALAMAVRAASEPSSKAPAAVRIDLVAELKTESPKPPAGHWIVRPADSGDPIRVEIRPGARSSVELPLGKRWEIGLEAEGFWAVRRVVTVEAKLSEQPVRIEVWPLGAVEGELKLSDKRDKLPKALEVAVLLPAERKTQGPNGRSGCDLKPKNAETVSFRCLLPATKLDLSFQPGGGFAPGYVRGVEISASKARIVKPLILRKGGSVAGWVRVEGGALAPGLCIARIEPALGPSNGNPRLGLSIQSTGQESLVAPDGSFEFVALTPGVYRLKVDQAGLSPFVSGPIQVLAGIQTLLQDAAVLQAPSDLEVVIVPEADPQGQPWQLTLIHSDRVSYGPAFEGSTNEQGIVHAKGLEAGSYSATISDAIGNNYWFDQQFRVGGASGERREIRLDLLSVRGTVRRADEALDAVLLFGGKYGAEKVQMEANSGKFFGVLPHGGGWAVDVEWGEPSRTSTVSVKVEPTGENRADVEIEIPASRVFGRVIDAAGQPAGAALVAVSANKGGSFHTTTDKKGAFEFYGIPEGEATFVADFGERSDRQSSEPLVRGVDAKEATGPIVLELRRAGTWAGRVQSEAGPVAGASVLLFSSKPGPDLSDKVQSDLDGRFEAHLPARVTEAITIVLAPGYGLRGLRLPRPGGTVYLSPEQGSVAIELPDDFEERLNRKEMLAISQDGLFLSLSTLAQWAQKQGSPIIPFHPRLVIPGLAPGSYQACFAPLDAAILNAGLVDPRSCVGGNLQAGGVLELDMAKTGGSGATSEPSAHR